MMRLLTQRQYEIVRVSLERWIDIERTAGNTIAAEIIAELLAEIARRPERYRRIA